MNQTETPGAVAPDLAAEFPELIADLAKGIRRPDKIRTACERMDRLRAENLRLFGEQDVAVELVRQTRDVRHASTNI